MADMMSVLLELRSLSRTSTDERRISVTATDRLDAILRHVQANIENAVTALICMPNTHQPVSGESRAPFSTHSVECSRFIGKFFFSEQYADRFKAQAEHLAVRLPYPLL